MADLVTSGQIVLLVWGASPPPSNMENYVNELRTKTGADGFVQVENAEMLLQSKHDKSKFDAVLSGTISPEAGFQHSDEILAEILKTLKPNGQLFINDGKDRPLDKLKSTLTMTGYTTIQIKENSTSSDYQIKCQKPNFEVGKSNKLSFAKKTQNKDVVSIWTLSANDTNDENVAIIDSDALLDENDLKKPDLSGIITDCGTSKSGKRKACKGCSCGLKEELSGEAAPAVKSACGSCYLGDAFRCASCPYLGMPPFKSGEQITLSDRQLQPDVY
ncbi:anamorsin homolog [Clytia hemisphaerica]|uniref:Anamorsin homolog n=1 Tax=Clytia hemisphaerica TaxID=252671 RepID=A0A7M5XBC7_9CNID